MPFTAKHKDNGNYIDITDIDNPKSTLRPNDWLCPLCNLPLTIKNSYLRSGEYLVRAHFSHIQDCISNYEAHPESREHLLGKLALRDHLIKLYQHQGTPTIQFEVPITMDWRPKGRIADIVVSWPFGWREVHEVQLSPITPQTLEERSNDYDKAGFDVTWWLGKRANTDANQQFLLNKRGEFFSLDFT